MELNLELYTHVNLTEIGVLLALIGVLLLERQEHQCIRHCVAT